MVGASLHRQAGRASLQTAQLLTSQLPRANQPRMELSPYSAACKANHDFQRSKRIDVEEQEQRGFLCYRIAAAVEASGVPAPSARRRRCRPSERYGKIVLTPAPLFWVMAEALVAQEEFLTWWQFQWHYRAQLASQL